MFYSSSHLLFQLQSFFNIKRPDGKTFVVPPENVHITGGLAIGDVVTFSYNHHSQRHIPVNPIIFKIRADVLWEDVVQLFFMEQKYMRGI